MKKVIAHPRWGEVTVLRTRRATRITVSVRPPANVRLTLPALCPLRSGLAFLEEKEEWISGAVGRMEKKYPSRIIEPPYHTYRHELVFNPSDTDRIASRITDDKITVTFPADVDPGSEEVQQAAGEAISRALRAEARETLPAMVENIARAHGFRYRSVTVRATTSRWGSCSSRDDISLSIYLMRLPRHLIEYIILHELCHTTHKDHSPRFHSLLDSHLGGKEKEYIRQMRGYRPGII